MKARLFSLVAILCFFISATAQVQTPRNVSMIANSHGYYEYLPVGYNNNPNQKFPLLLFIHGVGELGDGTTQLSSVLRNGPPRLIDVGQFPQTFTVNGQTSSFIVISPQFVSWPGPNDVDDIISYLVQNYKVDINRIYLTGLSMGGGVTWEYAGYQNSNASRLAAILPVCGASYPEITRCRIIAGANLPVWATHNNGDGTVPVSYTIDYVNNINLPPTTPTPAAISTIFNVNGHDAWSQTYDPNWRPNGLNVYEWMLQYSKNNPPPPVNPPPVVNAGNAQTISLPATSATLSGSATDANGNISSYSWSQIGGPVTASINSPSATQTIVSNLTAPGTYTFKLTAVDNGGASASANVTVTVNGIIIPPSGNNGLTAEYFTNTNNLLGSPVLTKTDAQVNFNWGPSSPATGISADKFSVRWTGKITTGQAGAYTFYVTSDDGSRLYINNQLIINKWVNQGSTETSGVITLQANSSYDIRLEYFDNNGDASCSFSWSGPGIPKQIVPTTNLYPVGVTPPTTPSNNPPVVNAGNAQTITLPASSVTLSGSATDADGTIASYAWSQVSGPAATISSPSTAQTTVTGLNTAGTYVFKLTATDNGGATASANITITVNSASTPPPSSGNGLTAEYFTNTTNLAGTPAVTRTDATVNFNWAAAAPATGISVNQFSARWSGKIKTGQAGVYNFYVTSDDGSRLYINNQLIINKWINQGSTETTGTITLEANTLYDIKLEYFENNGDALCLFSWSGPGINKQIVPTENLFPVGSTGSSNTPPVVNAGNAQTITLPATSATLSGSATDNDGTIASYSWTQVSGPVATISSPLTAQTTVTGLNTSGTYVFKLTATDNSGASSSANVTITVNSSVTPPASGNGLTAEYYSNTNNLVGTPALTRTDAQVNFNWAAAAPATGITADQFSVRWTGQIKTGQAGAYTFYLNSDDGSRLYVNNQLIINKWINQGATETTGTITLNANTLYDIKLEYFENNGDAICSFSWSGPGINKQIVPTANLFVPAGTTTAAAKTTTATTAGVNIRTTDNNVQVSDGIQGINIYPNPATSVINLEIQNNSTGNGSLTIYDMSGAVKKQLAISKTTTTFTKQIDINDLPKGTYLIKISFDKERNVVQFVKN